jgi:hypothetical protein
MSKSPVLILVLSGLLSGSIAFSAKGNLRSLQKEIHLRILQAQVNSNESESSNRLIQGLQKDYGDKAKPVLFSIARDSKLSEQTRYTALMAASRLNLKTGIPEKELKTFLKDKSWMMRTGALRIFHLLFKTKNMQPSDFREILFTALKDPALLVRNQAVQMVDDLDVKLALPLLILALEDPQNYHHGKPLMVPQKALQSIKRIDPKNSRIKN